MRNAYLAARLEPVLARWGRDAAVVTLVLAVLEWVGWTTGRHFFAGVLGAWLPMTPWTIVLASVLAVAILLQLRSASRAAVWTACGLAVLAGVLAVVFLLEYATGRTFGLDPLWFPESVRAVNPSLQGRPQARTGWSVLLLSIAVGLTRVDRRWAAKVWAAALAGAVTIAAGMMATFLVDLGKYPHIAVPPSSTVHIVTPLCVALLVFATAVTRPDRKPVRWVLVRPDRAALVQMLAAFAFAPVVTALLHGFCSLHAVNGDAAWVVSILMVNTICCLVVLFIYERGRRRQQESDAQFRAIIEHAPNAIAVLNARGDFEFANRAFGELVGVTETDRIVGRTPADLRLWATEKYGVVRDAGAAAFRGEARAFELARDGDRSTFDVELFPVRDGRGEVFCIGGIGTDVTERKRTERRLRERLKFEEFISRAINDKRLVVFSQPIVDARTGHLVEEELLVRIVGPDGELILPGDFLPQAQRFGMMPTIDKFMVAQGIELARSGRRVAVNLSADSINHPPTIAAITDHLRRAGDAAHRMSFEITESAALSSMAVAARFSNHMRLLGCQLALDDFGTGFGSFTELRGLALTSLKIDRSFVRDLPQNKDDESVVKVIVGIAKEFGLITTAEGIENAGARARLVELGVDRLQGYLIGRPAPVVATDGDTNESLPRPHEPSASGPTAPPF